MTVSNKIIVFVCLILSLGFSNGAIAGSSSAASIISVAWSPDGSKLAVGSADHVVRVLDSQTGQILTVLKGHSEEVFAVAWSPDGTQIASGGPDHTVRIWDTESGQLATTIPVTSNALPTTIFSISWNPNGTEIACGTGAAVVVYETITGDLKHSFLEHTKYVMSVDWDNDGKYLATGSWDGTINIWDSESEQLEMKIPDTIQRLPGIESVAWHPTENFIASSHLDNVVRIWDATTGALLNELTGHLKAASDVSWSPDGEWLASSSYDGSIRIWDVDAKESVALDEGYDAGISDIAWSPDGEWLASSSYDGSIRIWDVDAKESVILFQLDELNIGEE